MLRTDFDYLIQTRILILEGSLNTELQKRAKTPTPFTPQFVLSQGELITEIHTDFATAGADILITATAHANRLKLERNGLKAKFEEVNRKAVELARKALPKEGLLFAGLGATGALLKPYGQLTEQDYRQVYAEQAAILLDCGVDGFILEGFASLIEAEQCIAALREASAAPIIATMTFLEDGLSQFGDTMSDCFQAMRHTGADAVGIHGTLGPLEIESFLAKLDAEDPLCVRPNAGYPVRVGDHTTYLTAPDYVAECAEMFLEAGASLIGGAAGFTPEHIQAIATRLANRTPRRTTAKITAADPTDEQTAAIAPPKPDLLTKKLGREPILSVEIEPPKGLDIDGVINLLQRCKGVDAVNIPENPLARARISAIALAKVVRERTGMQSIAHVTCRDRNLISLQAELLGAHVLGVNTILALTGDPAGVGDFPTATSVFDIDATGLVEMMYRMNLGKDFGMNDIGARTNFRIGVAANPLAADLDAELARLERKLESGAGFVQTQPIFDPDRVEPFLKAVERLRVPVIFGVMLIRNYRHAKFLANEYPGVHLKDEDLQRFADASNEDQRTLGVRFAAELIRTMKPLSGGVYLMTGLGDSERIIDILDQVHQTT